MKHLLDEALGSDFEVLKLIGKGRQAEVFLARERALDRLVAVKVLLSGLAHDEVARKRFEREAKAAASVNHANATQVFRFGLLPDGRPYLVLQYVPGRTLEARISAEGPLPPTEARQVVGRLARALAAAHERGFVHRDVRPANVLCEPDSGEAILTDFGVAGIIPSGKDEDPGLTRTGEFLGDLKHLSPEELKGDGATEASDVYALGVLAYEALTGRGPFDNLPAASSVSVRLQGAPISLSPELKGADPQLCAVVEHCLTVEPDRRPSARFIAEALQGEAGSGPMPGTAGDSGGEDGILASVMRRRLPHFVVGTAGAGWILLEGVSQLVEMGVLAQIWYHLALATVLCGLGASVIITWFHGAKGRQKTGPLEIALLSIVGVVWVGILLAILLPAR